MNTVDLQNTVRDVVTSFVKDFKPFTALDISNKVKETLPRARHSEVRDLVREMFKTDLVASNYGKTDIDVTLANGTIAKAVLYHDLADSWDLQTKYDASKRASVATHLYSPSNHPSPSGFTVPTAPAQPSVAIFGTVTKDSHSDPIKSLNNAITAVAVDDWMTGKGSLKDIPGIQKVDDPAPKAAKMSNKEMWEAMFNDKVSLFPNH